MALFLGILIWEAVIKRQRVAANPWESLGVEWQVPTPVPVFNFDAVPIALVAAVRLRHREAGAQIFGPAAPALSGA